MKKKNILVTGAGKGIGLATTKKLLEDGNYVFAIIRDKKDNKKLINALKRLRDLGNTVIVVEHDIETMMSADHIIDLGPEGGNEGGEVIAKGTPEEIIKSKKSYTGRYLKSKI